MYQGQTVFSQIMDFVPKHQFRRCVQRYRGNHRVRSFTCYDQFLCMAFAQLTYRESLRDIECCLRAMREKLYHMGIRGNVSRSTNAYANENRDRRIYCDFAQILIHQVRKLYADDDFGLQLDETVYALDATIIDLCLSVFPWAHFRRRKAAIKLHTLLDLKGNIPSFIAITPAKVHEVNILDELIPEAGAIYIMDRGYLDFVRLFVFHQCSSFFDADKDNRLNLLTNQMTLPALTIAELYRCRWQVELFFKWIKQHLRIKAFYGTSENAVKTQIWIAISVYVLVAIIETPKNRSESLHNFTDFQYYSF